MDSSSEESGEDDETEPEPADDETEPEPADEEPEPAVKTGTPDVGDFVEQTVKTSKYLGEKVKVTKRNKSGTLSSVVVGDSQHKGKSVRLTKQPWKHRSQEPEEPEPEPEEEPEEPEEPETDTGKLARFIYP